MLPYRNINTHTEVITENLQDGGFKMCVLILAASVVDVLCIRRMKCQTTPDTLTKKEALMLCGDVSWTRLHSLMQCVEWLIRREISLRNLRIMNVSSEFVFPC